MSKEKINLKNDFETLKSLTNSSDIYYLSLLMLSTYKKSNYKQIPELALILDQKNFLDFIDVYGGKTIKVPTKKEVLRYTKIIGIVYYTQICGLSYSEAVKLCGGAHNDNLYNDIQRFKKLLKNINLEDI